MRQIEPNRDYRHFKGKLYYVENIVTHSETNEPMVLYWALYGEHKRFVRPLDMFLSEVDHEKYPDVKQKYRFELVSHRDLMANTNEFLKGKI